MKAASSRPWSPGPELRLRRDPRLCLVLGDHPIVSGDEYGDWRSDYDAPKDLYVLAVGRIRGSGRPTTTDFRVNVDSLHPILEPVKLRTVVREVSHSPRSLTSIRTTIARDLGRDTTTSYRDALDVLFPGLGSDHRRLARERGSPDQRIGRCHPRRGKRCHAPGV